ncbi:LPD7 domain-containing protein [Paraburkholderia susongensis]|uniref:Large polyvalent protein-associated domain-containing protein n=1 Tax=Paraburkholderia susongensis TaxID=1515439 RepID=A0A1X7M708_9BURK|nr:LPD7 domain-containing protein [Paraburkholderia susongensis]SMG61554.1 hypothetical protein SAMN06265784_12320 [Paraburkholderia susongensis]
MNSIELHSPEQLRERADTVREQLASLDWRTDKDGFDSAVGALRDIAADDWYVAADAWRESGIDAPQPDFVDPQTDVSLELRRQAADHGIYRDVDNTTPAPQLQDFDTDTLRAPANEPDAQEAANDPTRPIDGLSAADLARAKAARQSDRAEVEAMLRETASLARNVRPQPDRDEEPAAAGAAAGERAEMARGPRSSAKVDPVFQKSGYEVPKRVAAQYVAHEGKFLDRKSETVHFEDKGKSLATDSNDRKIISHMIEVAQAKNWGVLELKGSEEFRRQAWIAAQVAGMETRGFSPKPADRALLEVARQEMRIGAADRETAVTPTNTIEAADVPMATRERPAAAAPEPVRVDTAPESLIRAMREERAREIQSEAQTIAHTHTTTTSAELSRKAWVAAELAGVETVGYEPDDRARELLEAARHAIHTPNVSPSVAAARLVMEAKLNGLPASVQDRCRAEFSERVVGAKDLPAPTASQQSIEAARRAFFERNSPQQSRPAAPAQPDHTTSDPGMEISR